MWVVLDLGKRRVAGAKLVDGEAILSCTRTSDALVFDWAVTVEDLEPPEEAAEMLVAALGELLRVHRPNRTLSTAAHRGHARPASPKCH